jgi:hypothetical protein
VPGLCLTWHSFPGRGWQGEQPMGLGFLTGPIPRPLPFHLCHPCPYPGPLNPDSTSLGPGQRWDPRIRVLDESFLGLAPREGPTQHFPLLRFSGSQHCGHIHCAYQYREHYHCLDPECNYQVWAIPHPPTSAAWRLLQEVGQRATITLSGREHSQLPAFSHCHFLTEKAAKRVCCH